MFEKEMANWQPQVLAQLTKNRQEISSFDELTCESLKDMSEKIHEDFAVSEKYRRMCNERMLDVEELISARELPALAKDRDQLEQQLM